MENKYGEDFNNPETKKEVIKYLKRHPVYLNPKIFPNGIEVAYKSVRQANNNQNQQQQADDELVKQKKAAQLPRSKGSNIRSDAPSDQAEAIKSQVFNTGGGMFRR